MNARLRHRVEKLEDRQCLQERPPLVVLVRPAETTEAAVERTRAEWARPAEAFSLTLVINLYARSGVL